MKGGDDMALVEYNCAVRLEDSDVSAIRNGGEVVAKAIAKREGYPTAKDFKLVDYGNFYRLVFTFTQNEKPYYD